MKHLPQIINAKYIEGYSTRLTFDDGTTKILDLSPWLKGPVFKPLLDKSYFKKFFLDGGTICWPNGADIAPETLYISESKRANKRVVRTRKTRRTR